MAGKQMSREEAIQFLTMQRDKMADAQADTGPSDESMSILEKTGDKIGYAPAFRCLVKGLSPEESIKWGK